MKIRREHITREYVEDSNDIDEITEYTYNPDGIRVKSYYYKTINDGDPENEETNIFLIDSYNHTGYAQVLEQWSPEGTTPDITYTIGDDVISEKPYPGFTRYLLYDGHGSVRQVVLHNETIFRAYSYDAYGNMLGGNPGTPQNPGSPATNLLYAGEQFDTNLQMYYNRARYYDQNTGRFNRMDDFAGSSHDPQSLHKYLYCHANPVNATDPTGKFTLVEVLTVITITASIASVFIPVVAGVVAAAKAGVSPWEYISELCSIDTWRAALVAVGLGVITAKLLLAIGARISAKILSVVGALLSIWGLIKSIGLARSMAAGHISRKDIAHFLAFTVAVVILSVLIGRALKRSKGPKRLPESGSPTDVPHEAGIYEFKGRSGETYTGRSGDLLRRINEHIRSKKLPPENIKTLRWKRLPGSTRTDLEIAEQLRIDAYGGVDNLENVINAISEVRQQKLGI